MELSLLSLLSLLKKRKVKVPVTKEATKMDTDKAATDVASANETDVNMKDASAAENGTSETGEIKLRLVSLKSLRGGKKVVTLIIQKTPKDRKSSLVIDIRYSYR